MRLPERMAAARNRPAYWRQRYEIACARAEAAETALADLREEATRMRNALQELVICLPQAAWIETCFDAGKLCAALREAANAAAGWPAETGAALGEGLTRAPERRNDSRGWSSGEPR